MGSWAYRTLQVIALLAFLASTLVLFVILTWLIGAHGVIACGKGVFDSPDWFLQVVVLTGVPTLLVIGSGVLFNWCWKRLIFA